MQSSNHLQYSNILTCSPHLATVPTKIIEAKVNRVKLTVLYLKISSARLGSCSLTNAGLHKLLYKHDQFDKFRIQLILLGKCFGRYAWPSSV